MKKKRTLQSLKAQQARLQQSIAKIEEKEAARTDQAKPKSKVAKGGQNKTALKWKMKAMEWKAECANLKTQKAQPQPLRTELPGMDEIRRHMGEFPYVKVDVGPNQQLASEDLHEPATYGCNLLRRMMKERLSTTDRHALWLALQRFGQLSFGTPCAGSECPALVLGHHR